MTDAKIEELKQEIARQLLPNCGTTVASCELALKAIAIAESLSAELSAIREAVAPKMKEVDAIVRQIVSHPHDDNYIPAMRLASMLRFSILYAKREYHRAEHKNDQLESQLALVSTLTSERDEAREEVERMKNLLRWCADSMNKHSELDEAAEEGEGCAAEVLAAIQKQRTT